VRAADGRLEGRAIRQPVRAEPARVIDEAHREHEAALFIDQRETAGAQTIVVAIDAELELLGAAERGVIAQRLRRIVRRLQAILRSVAGGIELREQRAVVELERVEVAVGDGDHAFARATQIRRHVLLQDRLVDEHALVERVLAGAERAHVGDAQDDGFQLGDLAARHLHADGEAGGRQGLLHDAVEAHLPGAHVGELQLVVAEARDRGPQAVADRQLDVVLGEARVRRPREPGGLLVQEGVEVAIHEAVEAGAVAGGWQSAGDEGRIFARDGALNEHSGGKRSDP